MSAPLNTISSYSSQVRLWLEVDGRRISLSHAGEHMIIAKEAVELPPMDAFVVVSVDDEVFHCPVRLVRGMTASESKTAIESLPDLAAVS